MDVAGKRHGKGRFTCKDGQIQEGQWKNGKPDGEGFKVTLADGGTREGTMVDGKWEGHAVYTYVDGEIDDEEWKNGELKSESRVRIRRHSLNGHSTRRQKSDASRRTHSHTPRVLTHRKQREGSSTNSPQRRKTARSQEMQSPSTKRRSNTLSRADEVLTTPHSHAHAKQRAHALARAHNTHTHTHRLKTPALRPAVATPTPSMRLAPQIRQIMPGLWTPTPSWRVHLSRRLLLKQTHMHPQRSTSLIFLSQLSSSRFRHAYTRMHLPMHAHALAHAHTKPHRRHLP